MTDAGQPACPSCGHANPADAHFCRECGAILVEARNAGKRPSTIDEKQIPPLPADLRPVSRKRSPWIALVAGIVAVFAAFLLYQRNRGDSSIPVPGAPPPADFPTIPVPAPTVEQRAERPRLEPTMPPPRPVEPEEPARESRGEPPPPPQEHASRSTEPPPVEREGRLSPRQPGWYRIAFDAPLFESPSETAPILTRLRAGTRIRVTRVLPGFLAVESTTGKRPGYVSSDDALPESVAGPPR